MAKSIVTDKNVLRLYKEALEYTNLLTDPFEEYQRIARGEPYPDLPKKYPRVATGDTAAWSRQKSRQVIQQAPAGKAKNGANIEWLDIFGQDRLDNEIVPNATEDYDVLEKAQNNLQDAFNFGCKVTSAPSYMHDNGKLTPDMSSVFWGDLVIPAGYKSINAMPYVFIKGWWAKETVEELLQSKDLAKGGWNVDNLKTLKGRKDSKDEHSLTPAEKRQGVPQNAIEVVVAHQKGVKAPIIIFSPTGELILRTKPNPDPRGKKNIQVLYGWTDGTNPLGYSVVALVGPWQNLMDNDAQAYQYYGAYNVDPAMVKIGNFGDGELHPGAEFNTSDTNSKIELLELTSQSIASYPDLYEWQKSVLINMLNSPNSVGDPDAPLGKTPTGIQQAANQVSSDELAISAHVHDWYGDWAATALNIYFAEHIGVQRIKLAQETADKLRQLADEDPTKFDMQTLSADNILTFDFDQELPIFDFEVDGSSSKMQDETAQLTALQQLQKTISESPQLLALAGDTMMAKIYNRIVTLAGVHDAEELHLDVDKIEQQEAEAQTTPQSNEAKASITVAYKDLEPAARVAVLKQDYGIDLTEADLSGTSQMSTSAAIQKAADNLELQGVPAEVVPAAIQALTENVPLRDILTDIQSRKVPQNAA